MNVSVKLLAFSLCIAAVAHSLTAAPLSKSVPKGWSEDFEAAKKEAESKRKLILLAFSGSDWCGWCVKMEKDIYSDKKFISNAKKKFLLLMIDNPSNKEILSDLAKKQNRKLTDRYNVRGFPTTIVTDAKGEVLKRFGGYRRDGVEAFLSELDKVAESAGVKETVEISDDEAKKDVRFFPKDSGRSSIARAAELRRKNADNDLELTEFAGIELFTKKTREKPTLKTPYLKLSEVRRTYYTGNMLTGFELAMPAKKVKAMTAEALRIETCRLVRAIEAELGVEFSVTSTQIRFSGRKTKISVRSNRSSGLLVLQIRVQR